MNHTRRSDHHHYNHPSFSSSLLEQIYRSFDDDHHHHHHHHHSPSQSHANRYTKTTGTTKISYNNLNSAKDDNDGDMFRVNRFVLDDWMNDNIDNNNNNNITKKSKNNHHHHHHHLRRNSTTAITTTTTTKSNSNKINISDNNSLAKLNYSSSSTSSSDSSSGICGFSSSDAESLCGSTKSKNLKPIKTTVNPPEFHRKSYSDELPSKSSSNKQGNLQKRALKLYGDLKKVKQPISPGGKLASFLNSLFNSNSSSSSSKKPKISSSSSKMTSSNGVKHSSTSTPSTASSYSRSCLSKTPSSAGRFERRSVRFCPVSTVMAYSDENKEDNKKASRDEVLKVHIMEKQRRVEEVAKELLKNYHHGRKFQSDANHRNITTTNNNNDNDIRGFEVEDEDEDEDDDDLFELDHLLEVGGNQRYCEELPVYETTHVDTNRAIAKGLIL